MVNWFKEQFGHHEQRQSAESGIAPEVLFDELVASAPPGSMGLMLQPYWSPGIREPGLEAKGSIIGFGDVHTRAHVYRAILEGLAYALREGKERIEKRSGVPITELRISGGGSQSDAAMQLTADIFGLPTSRPHIYETSALGAAIDAAVATAVREEREALANVDAHCPNGSNSRYAQGWIDAAAQIKDVVAPHASDAPILGKVAAVLAKAGASDDEVARRAECPFEFVPPGDLKHRLTSPTGV